MAWPRIKSWSAPGGGSFASEQAKFHGFSGGGGHAVAQNQLGEATQQAIGSIAQIMQQRKQQQIAAQLQAAGADPVDAIKYSQSGMSPAQAMQQLKVDKIAKAQQQKQWDEEGQQGEVDKYYKNNLNETRLQTLRNNLYGGGEESPVDLRRQQLIDQTDQANKRQRLADTLGVKSNELSPAISNLTNYKAGQTEFPRFGQYTQGNDTPGEVKQRLIDSVKAYSGGQSTVKMKAPTGEITDVPPDQVDHYKQLGAVIVQ